MQSVSPQDEAKLLYLSLGMPCPLTTRRELLENQAPTYAWNSCLRLGHAQATPAHHLQILCMKTVR